jgi:DHA1 family multidrug resistance protein-like MFS transporter
MALTHGAAPPVDAAARGRSWTAQLGVLWSGQCLTVLGSAFVMPFLPLMVENSGVHGGAVALWSGALMTCTQGGMALFSPIWGRVADRTGRKPMLVRAMLGAGVTSIAIGLAPNVEVMAVLFFARGSLAGINAAGAALVTTMAPANRVAHSLGVLQSSLYIGSTMGPAIGAVLVPAAGVRLSFVIAGAVQFVAGFAVARFVEERFVREDAVVRRARSRGRAGLREGGVLGSVGVLLVMGLLAQAVASGMGASMPLRVRALASPGHVAVAVGVVATMQASASAVSALMIGRVGRRAGYRWLLVASSVWGALAFTALVFTPSLVGVALLASAAGFALGVFVPAVNTLLGMVTPAAMRAEVFGYGGTAFAIGGLVAPITATSLIAGFGTTTPFLLLAGLELVIAVWAARSLHRVAGVRA